MSQLNTKKVCIELKTCKDTTDPGALQKGADFVNAFVMGSAVVDTIDLLRLDDRCLESFMVHDFRSTLKKDQLGRAVGRIAGKDGKTKCIIENRDEDTSCGRRHKNSLTRVLEKYQACPARRLFAFSGLCTRQGVQSSPQRLRSIESDTILVTGLGKPRRPEQKMFLLYF